jgi:hypothetical protein
VRACERSAAFGTALHEEIGRRAGCQHRLEQAGGACLAGDEVVVVEEDPPGVERRELGDDLVGAAVAHRAREHRAHRAELALKGAAPLRHHRRRAQALVADDELETGDGQLLEGLLAAARPGSMVAGTRVVVEMREAEQPFERPPRLERTHQLEGRRLPLAPHHVGRVLERLVGSEADVRPTEHRRHAGGLEQVGEPVRGRSGRGRRRDADQIGAQAVVEVDRREQLAVAAHVVSGALEQRRDQRKAEAGQEGDVEDVAPGRSRLDEADTHAGQSRDHPLAMSKSGIYVDSPAACYWACSV